MSSVPKQTLRFDIDARVVYDLGAKLITDDVQALLELLKNAYDADASYAFVSVNTSGSPPISDSFFPQADGYILIEDNGYGMDWPDIERGWLMISASPKREMKERGETTPKGRTPLGDKGLGRLGSQRLGRCLEMWTRKSGGVEHHLGVDWSTFEGTRLSEVPIRYARGASGPSSGTRLLISGIRSADAWRDRARREELVGGIIGLLSPFPELRPFDVTLEIDGRPENLNAPVEAVLRLANFRVDFAYADRQLRMDGHYALDYLRPEVGSELERFDRYIAPDRGADFYAFLNARETAASMPDVKRTQVDLDRRWYVCFHDEVRLDELSLLDPGEGSSDGPADPGPCHGVIYGFPRRGVDLAGLSGIFDGVNEYRRYLNTHSGVRVYRDGFGVRPFGIGGNDWLRLGEAWTSGASWYQLRPRNVMGYVAISARDNPNLEETTSREGFVDNPYSRSFQRLMERVVEVISQRNEFIRRNLTEYAKLRASKAASVGGESEKEPFLRIRELSRSADATSKRLASMRTEVQRASKDITSALERVSKTVDVPSGEQLEQAKLLDDSLKLLGQTESAIERTDDLLHAAANLASVADVLEVDLDRLRDQLEMFSELAALGLTAEALSHEIAIIADGLSERSSRYQAAALSRRMTVASATEYVEHVRTAVERIRKQLSHLDPSLRYVRERRDRIRVSELLREQLDFHADRLERKGIAFELGDPFLDFEILINKGKLVQVIDNLVLNSEFWLEDDLRLGRIEDARIIVRSHAPIVEVLDTGRGIAPSVEHHLFEPFVTTKPKGVGRGLGLFVSRQLLSTSGCFISLLPERNRYGRRYIFSIDLTGALPDDG